MTIFWTLWITVGFLSSAGLLVSIWNEDPPRDLLVEDVGVAILALATGALFGFAALFIIICVVWDSYGWGKIVVWRRKEE